MTLVTLSEVKLALGVSGSAQDTQITQLLAPISAAIEGYVGRPLTQAEVTERYAGGVREILLRRFPVASVSAVYDLSAGETVDSSEYEIEAASGKLRRLPFGSFWAGMWTAEPFREFVGEPFGAQVPRWRVTYTGGPVSAPNDVKLAAYEAFAAILRGAQGGLVAGRDGDYSFTLAPGGGALPASAMMLLNRYRSPV